MLIHSSSTVHVIGQRITTLLFVKDLIFYSPLLDLQMESILRQCFVMNPKEYAKATDRGDDVFLCEYEYDIHWHSFKRPAEFDKEEEVCN